MATETVDLSALSASLEAAPAAEPVAAPVVEKPAVDVAADLPKTEPIAEKKAGEETKAEDTVRAELTKKPSQTLAKNVNEALKAFMAENKATPEGVAKLREINDAVAALYTQVADAKAFGKDVAEVTAAASELESIVRNNDELLYGSADPDKAAQLVKNVYADIVENSTPEAYDGFMSAALDTFKAERPEAYLQHVAEVYHDSLSSTGMVDAVRSLIKAFNANDQKSLRETISNIKDHIEQISGITEERRVAKETAATTKAAENYRIEQQDACNKLMNTSLSKPYREILNSTELGTMPREAQLAVAREVRDEALRLMSADQFYVKLLNRAFEKKDSAEVARLYKVKVNAVAQAAVDTAVKKMYPRGLGARTATAKAPAATYKMVKVAEGNARVISKKPDNLLRDHKRADVMMLNGRGYIPSPDGKGRILVSWKH